jgi:hypothetical protein
MNFNTVTYIKHPLSGDNCGILVVTNGVELIVPLDPANTDYQNIMALVEAGDLIIAPAEEPTE